MMIIARLMELPLIRMRRKFYFKVNSKIAVEFGMNGMKTKLPRDLIHIIIKSILIPITQIY